MRRYLLIFSLCCSGFAWAADEPSIDQPVVANLAVSETAVAPGDSIVLSLNVSILPTWHIYAHDPSETFIVTTYELETAAGLDKSGEWFPPPSELYDAEPSILIYKDDVTFEHDLVIANDAAAGTATASVKLRYQACDPYICLPPEDVELSTSVEVQADAGSDQ